MKLWEFSRYWDFKVLPQKKDFRVMCKNIPTFILSCERLKFMSAIIQAQPQELLPGGWLTAAIFYFWEISWFVSFKKSEFFFRQIWADMGWACLTHKQQISLYLTNQFTYNLCVCVCVRQTFKCFMILFSVFTGLMMSFGSSWTYWSECAIFRTVCTVSRFCCFTFTN